MFILKNKITNKDSIQSIVEAIKKIAEDDSSRVDLHDQCDWLEQKLKTILQLSNLLKDKVDNYGS